MSAPSRRGAGRRRARTASISALPVALVLTLALSAGACSSGPERSAPALCEQLALAQGLDEALATADATGLVATSAALERAADVAPLDIEPQVVVIADTTAALVVTVDTAGGDRRDALQEALRAREAEVATITAAGAAVATWSAANCGLDLDSGEAVPTTPPPTPAPADGEGQPADPAPDGAAPAEVPPAPVP